tara:strand:- start:806 stop:1069 length:264 start_codon:yes stop_codon:yes gene_type:complete
VPPSISGYEKVRITIMKPTPTQEMEQRIRMRYAFAMSSFGRMFLPHGITPEMRSFCHEWSEDIDENPPRGDLHEVDSYFLNLLKKKQ